MLNHVSFDVWNTLISPNPNFSDARNMLIAQMFDVSQQQVKMTYTRTKKACDDLAITHGIALGIYEVWDLFVRYLAEDIQTPEHVFRGWFDIVFRKDLSDRINKTLFIEQPPIILPELVNVIRQLYKRKVHMHIASNTNFIGGIAIQSFLKNTCGNVFASYTFSDQQRCAKPSINFFSIVYKKMNRARNHVRPLIHIGDDARYDLGAAGVGIKPIIISDPHDTVRVLKQIHNDEVI